MEQLSIVKNRERLRKQLLGETLEGHTRVLEASQEMRREQDASMQKRVGSLERAQGVSTAKPSQLEENHGALQEQRKHHQKRRIVQTIRCGIPPETEKHQQALILGGTGFEPRASGRPKLVQVLG
jgi:hypothetical protein